MAAILNEAEIKSSPQRENSPSPSSPINENPANRTLSERTLEFISEDHEFIRRVVPPAAILTLTKEYSTVIIMRTPYARIQLRMQYPTEYPDEVPLVELSSPTLPMPLLRKKEKECMEKAKQFKGKAQASVVYEMLYNFIHFNMFIPCWKEMKQVATLCEGKGSLSVDDKEGVLLMKLSSGNYRQNIKIKIPPAYPEEGVQIDFLYSNYPTDLQYMFKSQAEEIVRRCEAGFSADQALQVSNPIQMPVKAVAEPKAKMTASTIKNLKHDVNVLKQMSDLRVASTTSSKATYFTQANAEKREARKDLRRLAKAESEADAEFQKKLLEEEQAEMKDLLKCKASETAQPSLQPIVRFLVEDYACRLTKECCQACKQSALPADPTDEAVTNPKSSKRAMRTFCGHWLHYNCLNEWLTTPPFIRQCPVCDRRIWHPDWPEDYKQLEKAWQSKEARKREMSDVSDFMGMGAEFSTEAAKAGNFGAFL